MSREDEDRFIKDIMADIARGLEEYEKLEEDIESILPNEDEYERVEEDIETSLPDDGYEILEADTDRETMADLVVGLNEKPTGNSDRETMADLVSGLDEKDAGDSDKDDMTNIAQEITILEAKINTAKTQREQIVEMKKELSKMRGNELENQRNGIDR